MKRFGIILIFLCVPWGGQTQSVSGYWYGSAFVIGSESSQDNYLIELILTDTRGNVQGVLNYYFRNLYRSIPIQGSYDRRQQQLTLNNIPFIYHGSITQLEVDCYMSGVFNLVTARAGSSLSGQWKPQDSYKYTCPPIQVRLALDQDQSVNDSLVQAVKNWKEQYQVWTPPATEDPTDPIVALTPRPVKNIVANQQQETRALDVAEEFELDADSVRISLYDNGEVDGDSISVFLNKKLIVTHQRLSTRAIRFTLPLDSLQDYLELIMFAENLGTIPPNTALMVVEAGDKSYQVRITSTLEKSGSVRLKRKRKGLRIR